MCLHSKIYAGVHLKICSRRNKQSTFSGSTMIRWGFKSHIGNPRLSLCNKVMVNRILDSQSEKTPPSKKNPVNMIRKYHNRTLQINPRHRTITITRHQEDKQSKAAHQDDWIGKRHKAMYNKTRNKQRFLLWEQQSKTYQQQQNHRLRRDSSLSH